MNSRIEVLVGYVYDMIKRSWRVKSRSNNSRTNSAKLPIAEALKTHSHCHIMDIQHSQSVPSSGVGSVLIIPDVPLGLDFGIDCMSFETGPKFRGMSMIPQGLHFVYHSTGMAARQGFFMRAGASDVVVRQWDSFEEHICSTNTLSEDSMLTLMLQLRMGDLNSSLGPYPVAEHHIWQNLSCFILENVLLRASCPVAEIIYPSESNDLATLNIPTGANVSNKVSKFGNDCTEKDRSLLQGNFAKFVNVVEVEVKLRDEINASDIDHESRRSMLTSLYIDKSTIIEHLVQTEYGCSWENILGEMQLSFLLFLLIFCHDALEHWKKLVDTICRSERALLSKPDFTSAFMRILYEQLNFAPADFFANELSKDNFLRPAISCLFENLRQPKGALPISVLEHRKRLLNFFRKKFNLFLDLEGDKKSNAKKLNINGGDCDDEDEDKPIFVQLDEVEAAKIRIILDRDESLNHQSEIVMETVDNIGLADTEYQPECNGYTENELCKMSSSQIEIEMFKWRYPNLYDSMCSVLNEDMEMAALRILSEQDESRFTNSNSSVDSSRLAALEATMFLNEEVSKRTAIK